MTKPVFLHFAEAARRRCEELGVLVQDGAAKVEFGIVSVRLRRERVALVIGSSELDRVYSAFKWREFERGGASGCKEIVECCERSRSWREYTAHQRDF